MKSIIKFSVLALLLTACSLISIGQTGNPVGAIGGTIDVTPTGAAVYTIPIQAVPGTMGMEPNISIAYNSQSGIGLLGSNWQLEGLISIRRIPQNIYLDNNITCVNLDLSDRYTLDGNRLIEVQGTYGANGTIYKTEIESFQEITSLGSSNGGPAYFEVVDDNGNVFEYGKTDDSKQMLGFVPLAWFVNKITDCEGNYITFTYSQSLGQIVISEINYTGNDNAALAPYAKMAFSYTDNNIQNTGFVRGKSYTRTKLLQEISCWYQGSLVRKYNFTYDYNRLPRLQTITLTGEDSKQLNPTIIDWYASVNDTTTYSAEYDGAGFSPFRYDEDKCTDFYYWTPIENTTSHMLHVVFNECTGNLPSSELYSVNFYNSSFPADVNGDGTDEIVYSQNDPGGMVSYHYLHFLPIYPYVEKFDLNQSFVKTSLISVLPGDFNGDGIDEILFYTPSASTRVTFWGLSDGGHSELNFLSGQTLQVQDNNSNRKTEIMVDFGASTAIYEYDNKEKKFKSLVSDPNSLIGNSWSFYGDFNDDGLRDVLLISKSGSGNNHSCYVKINENAASWMWSYFSTPVPLEITFTQNNSLATPPFIGDMNGDKRDDIVVIVKQANNKIRVDVLYSDGYMNGEFKYHKISYPVNSFSAPNLINEKYYYCTDMNGDGTLDIFYNKSFAWKTTLFFHKNEQFELLKKVTDGFGAEDSLCYAMSSSPYTYYTSNFETRMYFPLLSDMYISNGLNDNMVHYKYNYIDVLFSLKRSMFFGFSSFITTNQTNGLIVKRLYSMNTDFDHVDMTNRNYYQDGFILKEIFKPKYMSWGKRFLSYTEIHTKLDHLSGVNTTTTSILYPDGRIQNEFVKNSRIYNDIFLSSTNNWNNYQTVVLPNSRAVIKIFSTNQIESIAGSTESLQYSTYYNYLDGRLNSVVNSNNSRTITTTFAIYNFFGSPRSVTKSAPNVDSQTEQSEYDVTGRFVTSRTNALGQTSYADYYGESGNISTTTDINGLISSYLYDEFGRERLKIYPDRTSETTLRQWVTPLPWFSDAVYSVTTEATASPKKVFFFDKLSREVFSYTEGVGYRQTIYNEKGQIDKESRPYNVPNTPDDKKIWTYYTYYAHGRIDTEIGPYLKMKYTYDNAINSDKTVITITDQLRNTNKKKSYDLPGRIVKSQDAGGIITYNYEFKKVNNKLSKVQTNTYNTNIITLISDLNDNLTSINDPNSGMISSCYDDFNRIVSRTDANQNQTAYQYDLLNRVIIENHSGGNEPDCKFEFKYDDAPGKGKGKLYYKTVNGILDEMCYYDNLSRIGTRRKIINSSLYQEFFEYNHIGQMYIYTFPDNFRVKYVYNNFGELSTIYDDINNSLICEISRNNFRKHAKCIFGNQTGISYLYNAYGMLTNISSGNLESGLPNATKGDENIDPIAISPSWIGDQYRAMSYTYNIKGLIERKDDIRTNQYETYIYDNLDRLTNFTSGTIQPLSSNSITFGINASGNITSNTQVGTYGYNGPRPYAVEQIVPYANCPISHSTCESKYNNLNLPSSISEDIYSYTFDYGSDGNRRSAVLTKTENGSSTTVKTTRYISPSCEIEITPSGTRYIDYIMTDQGVAAIRTKAGTQLNMYYVHTDHLGSYNFVMDASKNIVQSCHFDPWGNRKLYNNWSQNNTASSFLFSRGFTSHEHLDVFKIINMNARLYDPVIGRFFSPDPVIQDFEATQSLNRYSYCQNNPVNRVDVDGRWDDWVETEGEMKYDSRVIDQKTAIEFYGKDAIYRPIGHTYYDANDKQVILQDNDRWSYTGQIRPDPECPTCGDNNSNTLDWKLFQKGVQTYSPLLKAAEISLEVSATLLSGSVGFKGLFAGKMYLYHYTSEVAAKNISKVGLLTEYSTDGFIYLTNKAKLFPLQAQIELALPANRALPTSILRIDASGLSPSIIRRIQGNLSGMGAGGGTEFLFNQNIPANLIKIVK